MTARLTVKLIGWTETKVGFFEPIIPIETVIVNQIKGTLGITELLESSVQSDIPACDLDVDSEYPRCEVVSKGETVRLLKFYVNWVQNDVNQFGFYLVSAAKTKGVLPIVWEDFRKAKPMILSFPLYLLKSYAFWVKDDRIYDSETGPETRF